MLSITATSRKKHLFSSLISSFLPTAYNHDYLAAAKERADELSAGFRQSFGFSAAPAVPGIRPIFHAAVTALLHKMDKVGTIASVMGHAIKSGIGNDGNNRSIGQIRRRRRQAKTQELKIMKSAPI